MRLTLRAAPALALLLGAAACSRAPETGAAGTNAQAVADQLEAKADNLEMIADNSTNSDAAVALENSSDVLDQQSANLRAAASPNEKMK